MLLKDVVDYPAYTGVEDRQLYIYLPEGYDEDYERRYPVLYMFDGQNLFLDEDATYGKSWGLLNYLEESGTQLIVVAVECNTNPENGRLSEYSPWDFNDSTFGPVVGRGRETLEWFTKELKPVIDDNFRTLPDRRNTFIAGSSMGGLMSLYAVFCYNKYFSRCAALSPSLWVNYEGLRKMVRNTRIAPNTMVYMDYGSKEMGNWPGMRNGFTKMVEVLLKKPVFLNSRIVPHGNHSEASWERQLAFAIHSLMYGMD